MSRRRRVFLSAGTITAASLGLLVATSTLADTTPVGSRETVAADQVGESIGGFAVRLATALQLPGPRGGFNPEAAAAALWQVGVRVKPALNKTLTEADVTDALSQMGFSLRSDEPDRFVSGSRAGAIVSTFVSSASVAERIRVRNLVRRVSAGGNGDDDFNNGNGKGGKFKRKGHVSPTSSTATDDNW